MNIEYFKEFEKAKKLRDKKKQKEHIDNFINSFSSYDEKKSWSYGYLQEANYGHKIRHELYKEVIFPILLEGYKKSEVKALYFLGKTIENLSEELHSKIDFKTKYELLKECYIQDDSNKEIEEFLLQELYRSFEYMIHEYPKGLCLAKDQTPQEVLKELTFAKAIDKQNRHHDFFNEVEEILKKEITNLLKKPHELLEEVVDEKSFLLFVEALKKDREQHEGKKVNDVGFVEDWGNNSISTFLEASIRWAKDTDFGVSQEKDLETNKWKQFACFLYCGKIYE